MSTECKHVYLDWNIIIDLAESGDQGLLAALILARRQGYIVLLFSSTHIEEADMISKESGGPNKLVHQRLNFLSCLTSNLYLYRSFDVEQPEYRIETPQSVRSTITQDPHARESSLRMSQSMASLPIEEFREELNLHPNEVNNMSPDDIGQQIEQYALERHPSAERRNTADIIAEAIGWPVDMLRALNFSEQEIQVMMLMNLLDSFGYHPDKRTPQAVFNTLKDIKHASIASFCDVFVTDDKRLREKCTAAYRICGVTTQVMPGNEFYPWIVDLNKERFEQ
jgi:hypothetical protein